MSLRGKYEQLSGIASMVNAELDRRTRTPASEDPPTRQWATSPGGAVVLTVGGVLVAILIGSLPALAFHWTWGEPVLVGQLLRGVGVTVVAVVALYHVRYHLGRQTVRGLGLERRWTAMPEGVAGVALGAGAVLAADWIAVGTGVVDWRGSAELAQDLSLGVLVVALLVPLLQEAIPEELWFRGHLYETLSRSLPSAKVIVLTAVVFGALHILSEPPDGIVERLVFAVMATGYGFLLSAGRLLTAALWLPIGLHAGHNLFMHRLVEVDDGSYGVLLLIRAAVMVAFGVALLLVSRLWSRSGVATSRRH